MKDEKNVKYALFSSILIALGPILWLFINIQDKNYKTIVLNIVFVIIGITLVLYNLKNYLKVYNSKYNVILDLLRHIVSFIFYILLIASIVILFLVFYLGITFIQERLFIKGDYITYFIKFPYSYLLFVILAIFGTKISILFSRKGKTITINKRLFHWKNIDILIVILFIYIVLTSVVVVTKVGICDYSFYNLKGDKYSFSDVKYVNTGFVNSGRNKGEFFYNIQLKNGKIIKMAHPSITKPSDKYENDTWGEYVDIDKYIMDSGAEKSSSEKGSEYVQMDNIYVDKLLYVIRNK